MKSRHKKRITMAKMQFNEILAQRTMGCLGQVTKAFGHFFYVLTSRFVFSRLPPMGCSQLEK